MTLGSLAILICGPGAETSAHARRLDADHVPLTMVDGLPAAAVYVNGQGPFLFLIDTGGSSTMLSEGLASRLGLVPRARYVIDTVAGSTIALGGTVASLTLGPVTWADPGVLWMRLSGAKALDSRIDGLVGLDLLAGVDFVIDSRRALLVMVPATHAGGRIRGTKTPLRGMGGRYAVTATCEDARAPDGVALILDSGARNLVLFDSGPARALRSRARPLASRVSISGHAGMGVASLLQLPSLRIGATLLSDVTIVDVRAPAGDRIEDGLLPTRLFDRVYFAPTAGFVILNPVIAAWRSAGP